MRAPGIEMGVSVGGTGNLTLTPLSGKMSFSNAFGGSGTRLVEYTAIDGNSIETGLGTIALSTNVLTRTRVMTTWDGTTFDSSSPTALNISTNGAVYCADSGYSQLGACPAMVRATIGDQNGNTPLNLQATGSGTLAVTANRVYFVPVLVGTMGEVDAVYLRCTTATNGGTVKMAIYDVAADGFHGNLVADLGVTATITASANATTLTGPFLVPGWYYFALVGSVVNTYKTYTCLHSGPLGLASNNANGFYYETSAITYAGYSWPTTRNTGTGLTSGGNATPICFTYRIRN